MGMYTEFVFASELKRDLPSEVEQVLKTMTEGYGFDELLIIPDHDFFKCDRWTMLFTCDSYYFDGKTSASFEYDNISKSYYLTVRSNLKNYDSEIEKFLQWIKPYLDIYGNKFLGYYMYEEYESPTLIYSDEI